MKHQVSEYLVDEAVQLLQFAEPCRRSETRARRIEAGKSPEGAAKRLSSTQTVMVLEKRVSLKTEARVGAERTTGPTAPAFVILVKSPPTLPAPSRVADALPQLLRCQKGMPKEGRLYSAAPRPPHNETFPFLQISTRDRRSQRVYAVSAFASLIQRPLRET